MANAVKFWRRLLGFVLGCAFRLLYLSLRIEVDGESATTQCIIAFWHGEQLCLYGGLPSAPSVAAVSRSKDGELQVGVLRAFGVSAVRGSSSSGSLVVLRQLIRRVRDGFSVLFAVDGPRGPRKSPKLGAFYLSQKLNLPILPVHAVCYPAIRLRRPWDKMVVPLPFSRIRIRFGAPLAPREFSSIEDMRNAFIVAMKELRADTGGEVRV